MTRSSPDGILSEQEMLAAEAQTIWGDGQKDDIRGIALSGGGIRAAVVALGVLQRLADQNLLGNFSYMSTVSGGGYIASALSWFWSNSREQQEQAQLDSTAKTAAPAKSPFGFGAADFPFQEASSLEPGFQGPLPRANYEALANLAFLRNHGSYLTSGDGVGFAALVIAIVRTVIISLLVWLPVLVALFWLTNLANSCIFSKLDTYCDSDDPIYACRYLDIVGKNSIYIAFLFFVVLAFVTFLFSIITLSFIKPGIPEKTEVKIWQRFVRSLPYFALGGFIVLCEIYYFSRSALQPESGTLAILGLLGAARAFAVGAAQLSQSNTSYLLRRAFDRWSHAFLPITIAVLFIGALPYITSYAPEVPAGNGWLDPSLGGIVALLSGVGTALYGYYIKAKSILPGLAAQAFAVTGSILFLFGLLLSSYVFATQLKQVTNIFLIIAILSAFVISIGLGVFSSVNATGLHRFYRDRLMETFMPMQTAVRSGLAVQSDVADTFSINDMWNGVRGTKGLPYHIVNTHAILVGDSDAKVALRGGENFMLSHEVVGCSATGWMRTSDYIAGQGPFTLASAMAASGAAANANAGYIGTGITRERFVSAVMSTLNVRLGIWISNPYAVASRKFTKLINMTPTYFVPVLTSGIFRFGNNRRADYIELSDGGHFENLGIYELVRRKARVILAVDAEQDEKINLSALVSSSNRIKEDFGATLRFLENRGPEVMLGQESKQYPGGVKIAKSPFIVGEITYADQTKAALIYIKATMIGGLEFSTDGYRASNPDFPHQTTADQFFDPEQFEAYRDLGKKSCGLAIEELNLRANLQASAILSQYGFGQQSKRRSGPFPWCRT